MPNTGGETGTVRYVRSTWGDSLVLTAVWTADSSGDARRRLPDRFDGVLQHASASVLTGTGTYSIRLLDDFGSDALDGLIESKTPGSAFDAYLVADIDSGNRGDRPIAITGRHTFEYAGDASTEGAVEIRMQPGWQDRLAGAQLKPYLITWKADSNGDYDEPLKLAGVLDRVVTIPDAANPPTANYDITIEDAQENDLLTAQLANRSATATETVWTFGASAAADRHREVTLSGSERLKIANAGASNQGTIVLYMLE